MAPGVGVGIRVAALQVMSLVAAAKRTPAADIDSNSN
jgi:hypothetical protein